MAETPSSLQPSSPYAETLAAINENFNALNDENRTRILREGTTPRLLMGYQKDGFGTGTDYGLKISKSGYDVTTAADANLAFSTKFSYLKVTATGTASVTRSASSTYNFGVVVTPSASTAFVAYATVGSVTYSVPYQSLNTSSGIVDHSFNATYDASGGWMVFSVTAPSAGASYSSAQTVSFRYYLFVDTLT